MSHPDLLTLRGGGEHPHKNNLCYDGRARKQAWVSKSRVAELTSDDDGKPSAFAYV
jgi:hypothetical protein